MDQIEIIQQWKLRLICDIVISALKAKLALTAAEALL